MLGSRPLLSFDAAFDEHPHTKLMKALLTDTFGTPRGHPKSKPFVDRVLAFALADGKVWIRNYQILDQAPTPTAADPHATQKAEAKAAKKGQEELTSLVEIGPRFVLNPIRIFAGSFGGPTLYQNPRFVSPNLVRAERKRAEGTRLAHKMKADEMRKERKAKAVLPKDELADLFRQKA
jgi:ribosome biogenesis protein BRX1